MASTFSHYDLQYSESLNVFDYKSLLFRLPIRKTVFKALLDRLQPFKPLCLLLMLMLTKVPTSILGHLHIHCRGKTVLVAVCAVH